MLLTIILGTIVAFDTIVCICYSFGCPADVIARDVVLEF
jgi:hypothetical protein